MQADQAQKRLPGSLLPGVLAISVLAASYLLPIIGTFFIPLLPAPLAYARLRYGTANFLASSIPCILLVSITGGFPVVTAVVLALCISGYAIGGALRSGVPYDRAVFKAGLVPALVVGPLLGFYYLLAGADPWTLLGQTMDQGLKESVELYKRIGMSQSDIVTVLPSLKLFSRMLVEFLPAVSVCFMALTAFFNYFLVRSHAARAGILAGEAEPMNRWTAPDLAVWGVIVPGFLLIPNVPLLRQAAGNLFAVFGLVFLFQGVAVVSFYFEKVKLTPFLKGLGAFIIAMQPYLMLAMWCVGLFDTWADFRKLRAKQTPAK